MDIKKIQNFPLEIRKKIFYAIMIIFTVILFSLWMNDLAKRIDNYSEKYKGEKVIHSTIDYSQSMKKTKQIMDKVNEQMEKDLEKYDPEFEALEKMSPDSATTNTTSTISASSTLTTTTINFQ